MSEAMSLEHLLVTLEARDLYAEADFIRTHLTTPAQTVDVEAIKNTIDGMLIVAQLTRDDMTRDTFNNAAEKLSQAIGDKP